MPGAYREMRLYSNTAYKVYIGFSSDTPVEVEFLYKTNPTLNSEDVYRRDYFSNVAPDGGFFSYIRPFFIEPYYRDFWLLMYGGIRGGRELAGGFAIGDGMHNFIHYLPVNSPYPLIVGAVYASDY
jgi:hypothetical protein